VGRLLAITPQTVAETRFGALKAGWGPKRVTEVDQIVAQARVLPVDRSTIEQVAQLRYQCLTSGHPLHQPTHAADLWIAAAAIRWGLTLVAHEESSSTVPDLTCAPSCAEPALGCAGLPCAYRAYLVAGRGSGPNHTARRGPQKSPVCRS
jgi:predicted nucleic acid-binding protein